MIEIIEQSGQADALRKSIAKMIYEWEASSELAEELADRIIVFVRSNKSAFEAVQVVSNLKG